MIIVFYFLYISHSKSKFTMKIYKEKELNQMPLEKRFGPPNLQKSLKDKLFDYLMKLQQSAAQLKMNHWQTESFAEHKATDGFVDAIYASMDAIAESTMGEFGRPKMNTVNLTVSDINITSTKWVLESLKSETSEIIAELKTTEYEGLLALVGDFDGELKKVMYLTTLS
jgi:hypothetical protein